MKRGNNLDVFAEDKKVRITMFRSGKVLVDKVLGTVYLNKENSLKLIEEVLKYIREGDVQQTHPDYCSECSEIHSDKCPRRTGSYYADHGGWRTDLTQADLPKTGGYPKEDGYTVDRNWGGKLSKHEALLACEPNCKIHSASLIFSSSKGGGGIGGSHPIDRETFTIRQHDEIRLRAIYAYVRGEVKETGIPTIDKANREKAKQQKAN